MAGWGLMADDPERYPNKLQEVDLQTKKQCPSKSALGTPINSKYARVTLYLIKGGIERLAKSAPVHQGFTFEWP